MTPGGHLMANESPSFYYDRTSMQNRQIRTHTLDLQFDRHFLHEQPATAGALGNSTASVKEGIG